VTSYNLQGIDEEDGCDYLQCMCEVVGVTNYSSCEKDVGVTKAKV
jgi:hypothetical protein